MPHLVIEIPAESSGADASRSPSTVAKECEQAVASALADDPGERASKTGMPSVQMVLTKIQRSVREGVSAAAQAGQRTGAQWVQAFTDAALQKTPAPMLSEDVVQEAADAAVQAGQAVAAFLEQTDASIERLRYGNVLLDACLAGVNGADLPDFPDDLTFNSGVAAHREDLHKRFSDLRALQEACASLPDLVRQTAAGKVRMQAGRFGKMVSFRGTPGESSSSAMQTFTGSTNKTAMDLQRQVYEGTVAAMHEVFESIMQVAREKLGQLAEGDEPSEAARTPRSAEVEHFVEQVWAAGVSHAASRLPPEITPGPTPVSTPQQTPMSPGAQAQEVEALDRQYISYLPSVGRTLLAVYDGVAQLVLVAGSLMASVYANVIAREKVNEKAKAAALSLLEGAAARKLGSRDKGLAIIGGSLALVYGGIAMSLWYRRRRLDLQRINPLTDQLTRTRSLTISRVANGIPASRWSTMTEDLRQKSIDSVKWDQAFSECSLALAVVMSTAILGSKRNDNEAVAALFGTTMKLLQYTFTRDLIQSFTSFYDFTRQEPRPAGWRGFLPSPLAYYGRPSADAGLEKDDLNVAGTMYGFQQNGIGAVATARGQELTTASLAKTPLVSLTGEVLDDWFTAALMSLRSGTTMKLKNITEILRVTPSNPPDVLRVLDASPMRFTLFDTAVKLGKVGELIGIAAKMEPGSASQLNNLLVSMAVAVSYPGFFRQVGAAATARSYTGPLSRMQSFGRRR